MKTAFLSLGSNLGNREENLRHAIDLLRTPELKVIRTSSVIETEPVGFQEQPNFLNMAAEISTTLFPRQLLRHCQRIEKAMGRVRTIRNGPRTIDIDILLYGNLILSTPELQIPHPRCRERAFVLVPLLEIAPSLRDPSTGITFATHLNQLHG